MTLTGIFTRSNTCFVIADLSEIFQYPEELMPLHTVEKPISLLLEVSKMHSVSEPGNSFQHAELQIYLFTVRYVFLLEK